MQQWSLIFMLHRYTFIEKQMKSLGFVIQQNGLQINQPKRPLSPFLEELGIGKSKDKMELIMKNNNSQFIPGVLSKLIMKYVMTPYSNVWMRMYGISTNPCFPKEKKFIDISNRSHHLFLKTIQCRVLLSSPENTNILYLLQLEAIKMHLM